MFFDSSRIRLALYFILLIFSLILFALTTIRVNYTTHLPPGDTLNHGHSFLDAIAAELLGTSILTGAWSFYTVYNIIKSIINDTESSYRFEPVALFILWMLWIAGVAVSTVMWGNLEFCQEFETCRILSAMVGFAWIGWVVLTALCGYSLFFWNKTYSLSSGKGIENKGFSPRRSSKQVRFQAGFPPSSMKGGQREVSGTSFYDTMDISSVYSR